MPWLLDSYVTGSTTTAIAPGVQRPTLQFDGTTGTVAVEAGCNTGSGSYTVAGDQITFGPLGHDACELRRRVGRRVETASCSPC